MIFVTVGTHEQQFNRLVEYMDQWAADHEEDVVIQTGFSTYEPKNCRWSSLYSYKDMQKYIREARIVITHGGPSSFIAPLQYGKVPIVVPRRKEYNEHVNDHQLNFCREVAKRQRNIIEVENVEELENLILHYQEKADALNHGMESNNQKFCDTLEVMVGQLFD